MRFKAVAFDVDGTLYPSSALNARALPLVMRHPLLFAAFGKVRRDIRRATRTAPAAGESPAAAFRRLQAEMTASVLRSREPERIAALIGDVVYRGVAELFEGLQPYRGLAAALDELAGSGLRIAALSDLPPLRKLELMGLERRFEPVLCSEDSGSLKPAPEPFRMLCSALGLESAEILYVGNSRAYDLEGARAAGMAVAIVSRLRVPGADLSFADWSELSAFALSR